jgi:hypothetical protein
MCEITSRFLRRFVHSNECRMYKNFVEWDKNTHNSMSHFGIGGSYEAGCSSLRKLSVLLLSIFMTMEKVLQIQPLLQMLK